MASILRASCHFDVKRIAVVGAGPSGVAVAKYLLAENAFEKIDIFEQQSELGGVWNYTPMVDEISIPQMTPWVPLDKPIFPKDAVAPLFSNAMYDRLYTNIPKTLMQYSEQDFLPESLLFPKREDVREYILKYSREVQHLISFSTQVEDVRHSCDGDHDLWHVVTKCTISNEIVEREYDAVVIANGHYSTPLIPSVPGIESFNAAHPSIISHSKIYRSPELFTNKKVIIVGNGPSGIDIANQISVVCKGPLLNSVRKPTPVLGELGSKEEVSPIAEYIIEDRSVRFENGRVEKDIDAIVYCTGYLYSYPFLKSLDPPAVTSGLRVIGLYLQLFRIEHPTMVFTALPQKVIPFPVSEGQGAVIAKVWSNKLALPSKNEMEASEEKWIEEAGDGRGFHILAYPKDAEYINYMHDWVKSAKDVLGKEPPYWDEKQKKTREMFAELRMKFIETGRAAKCMKDLGADYAHLDR